MQVIAEEILSGAAASVIFTSIPSGYRDLLLTVDGRSDGAASDALVYVSFNADFGNNYDTQLLAGIGASASSAEYLGLGAFLTGWLPAASAGADISSSVRILVPSYSLTVFQKTVLSQSGRKIGTASGNLYTVEGAGYWRNTAAITEIDLFLGIGNFVTSSRATLWGLI